MEDSAGSLGEAGGAVDALVDVIRDVVRTEVAAAVARPVVYTTTEVALLLGVSPNTVRELVATGALWTVPLGASRTVRIPAVAVEALCQREAGSD